ncbi:spondin domain-containing protein [Colwelliaceae bacterium BS250]
MKIKLLTASIVPSLLTSVLLSQSVYAADLEITITNATQGIYYTPLVVAAHGGDAKMFNTGDMASTELQALAEGGDISAMVTLLNSVSADISENPAAGLLAPGKSTTAMLMTTAGNDYLSIAAMMLPTNDGFVGLNSWMIPTEAGTYTFTLNAYDAGTEVNDEIINGGGAPGALGIPVDPGMAGGTGAAGITSTESNTYVHIHRGNVGDADEMGGASDLSNTVHRWLNPVAVVTVVVK